MDADIKRIIDDLRNYTIPFHQESDGTRLLGKPIICQSAADLIERLVEDPGVSNKYQPPIEIGDTFFTIWYDRCNDYFCVESDVVSDIWYNSNGWFFIGDRTRGPALTRKHIGRSVFLNRKDAEERRVQMNACVPVSEVRNYETY